MKKSQFIKSLRHWYSIDYDDLNILNKIFYGIKINLIWSIGEFFAKRVSQHNLPDLIFHTKPTCPSHTASSTMASYSVFNQRIYIYIDKLWNIKVPYPLTCDGVLHEKLDYAIKVINIHHAFTRVLTHEMIHHILFRDFGMDCCESFDNIAYRVKEFSV